MPSDAVRHLCERLKDLRAARGFTQEKVAEIAGVNYKHYQDIEGGRAPKVQLPMVEKLAKVYGLDAWELLAPEKVVPMVAELQAKYGRGTERRGRRKS